MGYYGDRGDEVLDETKGPGNTFLAEVCKRWEEAASPLVNAGTPVVNPRFGMILSTEGGVLKKLLPLFKKGLAGVVGNGKQYMSWVSIDDVLELVRYTISNRAITGPVNFVSPNPVTNREFTKTLGRLLHRPTILPLPAFAARAAAGEKAAELLLASARAAPAKLVEQGYQFRHPELEETLKYLLEKAGII